MAEEPESCPSDPSPVLTACRDGNLRKVRRLITTTEQVFQGHEIDDPVFYKGPPIGYTGPSNLYKAHTDLYLYNWYTCAMSEAIRKGQLDVIKYFIEELSVSVDGDPDSIKPLVACSVYGSVRIAQYLTDKGADCNITCSEDWTPLLAACFYNQLDMVEFLLKQPGIEVNKGRKCQYYYITGKNKPRILQDC